MKIPLLFRKMLRDMSRSLPAYLISGCIVTMGVVGYSVLSITCDNLTYAQEQFYKESALADGFVQLQPSPKALERRIERVEGITQAQGRLVLSGRVMDSHPVDAELRLYSFTDEGVCRPIVQSGRQPGKNEILLGADFMKARGLVMGDSITLTVNGRKLTFNIVGTTLAPETVYLVKNIAELMPDPLRYDAGFIDYDMMSLVTGYEQMANSFVFMTDDSRDFEDIKEELELLLGSYGVTSIFPRKDEFSHAMLQTEIDQIGKMNSSVPFLFLGIASIIITIALSRLVEQQRVQIGTLMALGLPPNKLMWHYCGYGMAVGGAGGLLGGLLGILFADGMSGFYRQYFKVPSYGLYISPWYLLGGIIASVAVCGGVACLSAHGLLKLTPAVALRPAPPHKAGKTALERLPGLFAALTVTGRIAVRGLFRNKRKTVLSIIGVACAYMISAALLSMFSMIDLFIFDFFEDTQRQDMIVSFSRPVQDADAMRAVQLPLVELAECIAELPITLVGKNAEIDCTLMGLERDAQLYKLYNKVGDRVQIETEGVVISQHMSNLLGAGVGDRLSVKTTFPVERTEHVFVTGICEQYLGSTAYASRQQLSRISDLGSAATAVYIKAPYQAYEQLRSRLQNVGVVGLVQTRAEKVQSYKVLMGSFDGIFFAMAMLGVIIGFAVVYTGSLISFEELKREVSTLLALGLSSGQAVEVISVGQWLIAIAGMLLGVPMAMLVSSSISSSMSTELYSIPSFINPSSLMLAAGLTMLSVWLGTLVILRKLNKLNPVELLRERE